MEVFRLHLTQDAEDDLANLDQTIASRIADKLQWFISQENPLYFSRRLSGFLGKYRFRVGDYRIIFKVDYRGTITILVILRIRHRREVYD